MLSTTTTLQIRFGYMTSSLENLEAARELAQEFGFAVDLLPLDAPAPEPGAYDGVMVDFPAAHGLARRLFLDRITKMAKRLPVVVFDQRTPYQEAAAMRAAGIKWFPVLKAKAFAVMLAHPLAKSKAASDEDSTIPTSTA
jgi:hypothetical protein